MPLPTPQLDDRDFSDLLEQAYGVADRECPEWDVRAPGDPGAVLLECFAHLTDTMLYRLNRLPDKVYVELLRLIGVTLLPPAAARAELHFVRDPEDTSDAPIRVPRRSAITCTAADHAGQPVIFLTAREVELPQPGASDSVPAYHCQEVQGEFIGNSTGHAGQKFSISQAPVIAPSAEPDEDLLIGVEIRPGDEVDSNTRMIEWEGIRYRIWREVPDFSDPGADPYAFVADRHAGHIHFAPARHHADDNGRRGEALAAIPTTGAAIRAWYRYGGGPDGNVIANSLTQLAHPIPFVTVTNPTQAQGGRQAEHLEAAMQRGPHDLHSLRRAVTARDFERLSLRSAAGIARARAYAKAEVWPHATPGTVALHILPRLSVSLPTDGSISRAVLERHQTNDLLQQVRSALDGRRPLGTRCDVQWARSKQVAVQARVVAHRDADPDTVEADIRKNLHTLLRPVATEGEGGWPFGRTLHASHIYGEVMAAPGVRYIDGQVGFEVEESPDATIGAIDQDHFKPGCWYAASGGRLFRSTNNGAGWEPLGHLPDGERVQQVLAHPRRAGVLAVHAIKTEGDRRIDRLYIGEEYGDRWDFARPLFDFNHDVEDCCWLPTDDELQVLAATDAGLYELRPQRAPVPVELGEGIAVDNGIRAVATDRDAVGRIVVVVAVQGGGGLFVSTEGGIANSFQPLGLQGKRVRAVAIARRGSRRECWVGLSALGDQPGEGALRYDLDNPAGGWKPMGSGWRGGSCTCFAFHGNRVFAGTHHAGVVNLLLTREAEWQAPVIGCGLPIRSDSERLYPITTLAVDSAHDSDCMLIGTENGLFAPIGNAEAQTFDGIGARLHHDQVTIPPDWVFTSGPHAIEVVHDD